MKVLNFLLGVIMVFSVVAFSGCDSNNTLTADNGLKYKLETEGDYYELVGVGSFSGEELVIPSQFKGKEVREIDSRAFANCKSLKSVEIPATVTDIDDSVFERCSNLETITFAEGSRLVKIGDAAFRYCESLTEFIIPDSVTEIGEYAFAFCRELASIEIPRDVLEIESYTFDSCESLTTVTFAENSRLTEIGDSAFLGCISLTTIALPSRLRNIDEWAFSSCSSLVQISIPDSVVEIEKFAFAYCKALTSVRFGITSGWRAGNTRLLSADLSNPATAAAYLTSNYLSNDWSK